MYWNRHELSIYVLQNIRVWSEIDSVPSNIDENFSWLSFRFVSDSKIMKVSAFSNVGGAKLETIFVGDNLEMFSVESLNWRFEWKKKDHRNLKIITNKTCSQHQSPTSMESKFLSRVNLALSFFETHFIYGQPKVASIKNVVF